MVHNGIGDAEGVVDGELVGLSGDKLGELVGLSGLDVGTLLGLADGETVGAAVTGDMLGGDVGVSASLVVGFATGDVLGEAVGVSVTSVATGAFVGCSKPISATAGLLLGSCKYEFAKFEETFTQPNYIIITIITRTKLTLLGDLLGEFVGLGVGLLVGENVGS